MPNIEEARDLKTGDVYRKNDILDSKKIGIMRERLLVDVHDSEVVLTPVRRSNAPHFRRLCTDPARRLDAVDPDPSHNTCRDALLSAFQGSPVKISTYWFDEDGERHRQVLAELGSGTYQWWRETRVNAGRGEYIQPDLMGRDATVFLPNAAARGVVIEVIRTHYPNRATFFSLLTMSVFVNVVVMSLHAHCFNSAGSMRSGLSQTSSFNSQLRADPDQRWGFRALAWAYTISRCANTSVAMPL